MQKCVVGDDDDDDATVIYDYTEYYPLGERLSISSVSSEPFSDFGAYFDFWDEEVDDIFVPPHELKRGQLIFVFMCLFKKKKKNPEKRGRKKVERKRLVTKQSVGKRIKKNGNIFTCVFSHGLKYFVYNVICEKQCSPSYQIFTLFKQYGTVLTLVLKYTITCVSLFTGKNWNIEDNDINQKQPIPI